MTAAGQGIAKPVAGPGFNRPGVRAAVRRTTGARLGTRQAQQIIRVAAVDFGAFYAGREYRPPPGAAPGAVLGLSCDAKGIAPPASG